MQYGEKIEIWGFCFVNVYGLMDHLACSCLQYFGISSSGGIFLWKLNKNKSFENENVCDVLMNEIVMENEPL